jgi:rhamnose transport system ATP-binding protein
MVKRSVTGNTIDVPMPFIETPLLEASGIAKSYAGVRALKGVSFELRAGEVHALIGENGAGKSTLIKVMTGAVTADSGTLRIAGETIAHNDPATARALGIAAIYQQPALFPHLTVMENIALGTRDFSRVKTPGGNQRKVDWPAMERRAKELLQRAGATIDPRRLVGTLSMPEQQLVEIAKAIGVEARVVIMDEPTASLTETEVVSLFKVIGSLKAAGTGIIYISHRLEEISAIADRITVLRDGESIGTVDAANTNREQLIAMMVGREIAAVYPKREVKQGAVALELRKLGSREAGVSGVSLSVRQGEILGIAGLVGSGRTQLAETLFGLTPADTGEILINGQPARIETPADAIAQGIGYLPEDRRRHGAVLEMSIASNISLASLNQVSGNGLIDADSENKLASQYVDRLRVKTSSIEAAAGTLSGGNQQKVALARWLATNPKILILDEPTQGVDVGSKSEIHGIMMDLAAKGLAIVMISSELPEVLGMSDRIVVFHEGRIVGELSRAEATQEKILTMALGHAA